MLPPALHLMGPTATGKSLLAVKIAQAFDCEIISVDSALVYRGMDIGTAKPTLAERGGIKHHLLSILDPAQVYSAAQFRRKALILMADCCQRGKIPLLTGGTMLYFYVLFNGLVELPANQQVRLELDNEAKRIGWLKLHQRLQKIDPISALRIHPHDTQRIQRALEVFALTSKTLEQHFAVARSSQIPYQNIKIIIAPKQRQMLHAKISLRFQQMLHQGFQQEVGQLYQRKDLTASLPAMRAVGYRQMWQYLEGSIAYQDMVDQAIVATRQLAKRQFTWLRKIDNSHWYDAEENDLSGKIISNLKTLLLIN